MVGKPFGLSYEIYEDEERNSKLKVMSHKAIEEIGELSYVV